MYLQIEDPSDVPVPPSEVRIRAVEMQPYQDRRRVRSVLHISPFQSPPNISIVVEDARGEEVSSLNIIGATEPTMSLTIHIRDPEAEPPLRVGISVEYEEHGVVDRREEQLTFSGAGEGG